MGYLIQYGGGSYLLEQVDTIFPWVVGGGLPWPLIKCFFVVALWLIEECLIDECIETMWILLRVYCDACAEVFGEAEY